MAVEATITIAGNAGSLSMDDNTADVSADEYDPVLVNNLASESTEITVVFP